MGLSGPPPPRTKGVKENPAAGMGLKSVTVKGNRATTQAKDDLYRRQPASWAISR
jgi:hypothetical protein